MSPMNARWIGLARIVAFVGSLPVGFTENWAVK
jgi:hypothetical protein